MSTRPAAATPPSPREIQMLQLMAAGKTNVEIATELGIAVNTVRSYAQRLFRKLDVNTRVHAVTRAYERGIITINR
jgi:DNA-binding CsgD family transcriptional regulator